MSAIARTRRWRRRLGAVAGLVLVLGLVLAGLVAWLNLRGEAPLESGTAVRASAALIERGAYLARAGNCIGCHAGVQGEPFAGGRGVETPFGVVYASNLTPDAATGLGRWSPAEFWRALHHGRSKDGRLLYPAFPYPSYTRMRREDSDALYAFLRGVAPVERPNRPHALRFPFGTQPALAVWRALFFEAEDFAADPAQSESWNRGKYLVQALGHCTACHSSRNALGATSLNAEFAGGLMPDGSWYAPSLANPREAGVQAWPRAEVARLLKTGRSTHATVAGPMADVVYTSTQHLRDDDLDAMAQFLASIPVREAPKRAFERAPEPTLARGAALYETHCAACHGDRGQGVAGIYPALAGNRAVTLGSPANVIQVIRWGGFAPSTPGHPRPFGMPPFSQVLGNDEIASVASFIRQSWGNGAAEVTPVAVRRVK
ncbi:MAG TPA: cytochrome c [Methylibium sp.]|uniref:c-type cytochrome n=1 Tax=Methylibium sp. TaxID=2067992 RepID=UPI002DB6E413|nr:cytochrome c [Methylibium sp.]HEU4458018.1 cytochrome c [Methylibium sp.]